MSALLEGVGLLAFATNVLGNMLIARRDIRAFAVRIASNVLWFAYGWSLGQRSLAVIANAVVFAGINAYSYVRWRKARQEHEGE